MLVAGAIMRIEGAAFIVAVVFVIACGSPARVVNPCTQGCFTPTAADTNFIEAFCQLGENCCVESHTSSMGTVQGCENAVAREGLSEDPSLQAACLSELKSIAGTAACFPAATSLGDPCTRILYEPSGPQQPGDPCTKTADCAGSPGAITMCESNPAGGGGACAQMKPGQSGDSPCLGQLDTNAELFSGPVYRLGSNDAPIFSGFFCASTAGLYCEGTTLWPPQCRPLIAGGQPCYYFNSCASQSCSAPLPGLSVGTCQPVATVGEPCAGSADDGVCDDTSYCPYSPSGVSSCAPKQSAGATCSQNGDCASNSCVCTTTSCASSVCAAQGMTDAEILTTDAICGHI